MGRLLTDKEIIQRQLKQQALREQNERIQSKLDEKNRRRALQESYDASREFNRRSIIQEQNCKAYGNFKRNVKEALLTEAIMFSYSKSIPPTMVEETYKRGIDPQNLQRGFVQDFIKENGGVSKLLTRFKYKNDVLAEYASLIESAAKDIADNNDKSDPSSFGIPTNAKETFYSGLAQATPEEVIDTIKSRVADSISGFLDENRNMKNAISEIISNNQAKSEVNNDQLKEQYHGKTDEEIEAIKEQRLQKINVKTNKLIREARDKYSKSVLGEMVKTLGKSVMKDQVIRESFFTEGTLNVDALVETAVMMYGLLETVNALQIVNVDEEYIQKVLEDMSQPSNPVSKSEQYKSETPKETTDPTKTSPSSSSSSSSTSSSSSSSSSSGSSSGMGSKK